MTEKEKKQEVPKVATLSDIEKAQAKKYDQAQQVFNSAEDSEFKYTKKTPIGFNDETKEVIYKVEDPQTVTLKASDKDATMRKSLDFGTDFKELDSYKAIPEHLKGLVAVAVKGKVKSSLNPFK